jgi:hypothetical protein
MTDVSEIRELTNAELEMVGGGITLNTGNVFVLDWIVGNTIVGVGQANVSISLGGKHKEMPV